MLLFGGSEISEYAANESSTAATVVSVVANHHMAACD